jgi:hypothetical protein
LGVGGRRELRSKVFEDGLCSPINDVRWRVFQHQVVAEVEGGQLGQLADLGGQAVAVEVEGG